MIRVILLAAALTLAGCTAAETGPTAVDAERAFAEDAQKQGQWTAFRKWAAPDALMFTPQPIRAHDFLEGLTDPREPVRWWPGESYVSCDGRFAVNTGPWVRDGGKSVGYFTTVWRQQADGWRWVYDAGDELKQARPRPEQPKVRRASCAGKPPPVPAPVPAPGFRSGQGQSPDNSLSWMWSVSDKGERRFTAAVWSGDSFDEVIADEVAAP